MNPRVSFHASGVAEQDFLLPFRMEWEAETREFPRDTRGASSFPGPIPVGLPWGQVLLCGSELFTWAGAALEQVSEGL